MNFTLTIELMRLLRPLPLLLSFSLGAHVPALAQIQVELSWGSSFFEEKMVASDGTALDPNNLIIEIGSFDNSFAPNHSNMGQWLAEWRVFDAVTDTDAGTGTTDADPNDAFTNTSGGGETARFAGQGHLLADTTSNSEDATPSYTWSPGEQAYIFIRDSDAFLDSSEWLLLTSHNDSQHAGDSVWEFPAVTGGQPQFSVAWWLDDADAAVVGALDGGSGNGGDTGMGGFSDGSTDFGIRLHSIPEPNSLLLVLTPVLTFLYRRRRR